MSYNTINHILNTNKLSRPNYMDWKRNLDIVFTSEELKWVTQRRGAIIIVGRGVD